MAGDPEQGHQEEADYVNTSTTARASPLTAHNYNHLRLPGMRSRPPGGSAYDHLEHQRSGTDTAGNSSPDDVYSLAQPYGGGGTYSSSEGGGEETYSTQESQSTVEGRRIETPSDSQQTSSAYFNSQHAGSEMYCNEQHTERNPYQNIQNTANGSDSSERTKSEVYSNTDHTGSGVYSNTENTENDVYCNTDHTDSDTYYNTGDKSSASQHNTPETRDGVPHGTAETPGPQTTAAVMATADDTDYCLAQPRPSDNVERATGHSEVTAGHDPHTVDTDAVYSLAHAWSGPSADGSASPHDQPAHSQPAHSQPDALTTPDYCLAGVGDSVPGRDHRDAHYANVGEVTGVTGSRGHRESRTSEGVAAGQQGAAWSSVHREADC